MLPRHASIAELFMELVAVPSPSGHERALGEQVRDWLADAGVAAGFDASGDVNGSDAGNLIATIPGAADMPACLFVAHLDTVEAGSPAVRPQLDDAGVIRSSGETILGADNKSAVAAVMRLCAAVNRLPAVRRPTVVAAFTCREESGRMGVSLLDPPVAVRCAFCIDGSKPIGTVITRALGQTVFSFAVHGRTAHAAANPEAGVSAIRVASEIVAELPIGRLPSGGSASVAAIVGGAVIDRLSPGTLRELGVPGDADGPASVDAALQRTPTNSVPARAVVRGEVRGYSVAEMEDTVQAIADTVARVCAAHGARFDWVRDPGRMIPPFPGSPRSRALELVRAAAATVPGVCLVEEAAQATLEANYLAATTDVVAIASGGRDPHQVSESITVTELEQLEALLMAIVDAAARAG
ncbi:MAG TPA: M20/M25/M40 family metallo-hydrolase [Solirubrobacteraceae bacterium]|nr:M20/M25/M40 family metallo-hydrolase [Solirubrobacteraceae bacterium]